MESLDKESISKDQIQYFLQGKNSQITSNQILQAISFLSGYGYKVIGLVDSGSFGIVIKALNADKQVVAIKLMIVTNYNDHKGHIQEYQKCNLINHPNVIKNCDSIYDQDNDCFFIVQEFCEKGNLARYSQQNKLSFNEIIKICIQIIEGVQALHDKNIIHSDLKPQNILINDNDQIKICDLGFSKQLIGNKSTSSVKGGSLDYMGPEQLLGIVSKYSDIYAIGCIICYLCNVQIFGMKTIDVKKGIFPQIKQNEFSQLVKLAFSMMKTEEKDRTNLKDCLIILKQLQNNLPNNNKNINKNEDYVSKLYQNGDKYVGEFKDNKKEGQGILYYKNGDKYEGSFKNDQLNGIGNYFYKDGSKYIGEFVNDKKEGRGAIFYKNLDTYEGQFQDDLIHGRGIMKYSDTSKYAGYFFNGQKEGKGVYLYKNGEKYEGNYQNGLRNGKGTFYYKDGSKYNGDWVNDQREGHGIQYQKDGSRYEGYFKNNHICGQGIFYNKKDEKTYEGEMFNDKKEGFGISYESNGEKYEGYFSNDKYNGQGIFYYSNGNKAEGDWVDGEFKRAHKLALNQPDQCPSCENIKDRCSIF